ncbi:hypothetical protein Tco_0684105 [Tanacetum coccineum]
MSFLTSIYSLGNIMDEVDIEDLTIEQYLRLTQESHTPKKIEDMTIAEYLEYEKKGVENMKDALISIIKTIRQEMKDGIMKSHNLYATTTLDAKDNVMPQRVYEYLGLDKLIDRSTLENTITIPQSTRTQIDVFKEEISFGIGSKKFKFNIDSYQSIEKIYMVDIGKEEETFNPLEIGIDLFSYESPTCLEFEQRTRSYGTPNPQDVIAKPISFSPDRRGLVKRWHVCKPVHVTYDDGNGEDYGMWPTCDPNSKFCFGYNEVFMVNEQGSLRLWICFRDHERRTVKGSYMGFADFLQVRYRQQNIDDTTRKRSYDVKEEYTREIGNPYSRRFDEYNRVFNNEIEHLSNEYILRIGKKGYVLDDV